MGFLEDRWSLSEETWHTFAGFEHKQPGHVSRSFTHYNPLEPSLVWCSMSLSRNVNIVVHNLTHSECNSVEITDIYFV